MKSRTPAPDPALAREAMELLDGSAQTIGAAERKRLRGIVMADRLGLWEDQGHPSYAGWLSARHGMSQWKARREIEAAYALEELPVTAAALSSGALHLDKVLELARFADPGSEEKLVRWARTVSPSAIRKRADRHERDGVDAREALETRFVRTWDQGNGSGMLEAKLPSLELARVRAALERLAGTLPEIPSEDGEKATMEQKMADALGLMAATVIAEDQNPDLASVMVFVDEQSDGSTITYLADGTPLDPVVRDKLLCDARLQPVATGKDGDVGVGRKTRAVAPWLRRLVFKRDEHTCRFTGCGEHRFLHPHHVEHWGPMEGETQLANLLTLCTVHHDAMHEGRWSVTLDPSGEAVFFRPSGRRYDPNPPGVDEAMELHLARERAEETRPAPAWVEAAFRTKNFEVKEIAAGFSNDLYEVAKNLAGY